LAGLLALWLQFSRSCEKVHALPAGGKGSCHFITTLSWISVHCLLICVNKTIFSIASVHEEKGLCWRYAMLGERRLIQTV